MHMYNDMVKSVGSLLGSIGVSVGISLLTLVSFRAHNKVIGSTKVLASTVGVGSGKQKNNVSNSVCWIQGRSLKTPPSKHLQAHTVATPHSS